MILQRRSIAVRKAAGDVMRIVYEVRGRIGLALMDGKFGGVDVVPLGLPV